MWRRWDGVFVGIAITVGFACGGIPAVAQDQPTAAILCGGETVARGTVREIIDGRTFTLDDGRDVRLAAIEVPPLPQNSSLAPGGGAARNGLAALAAGDVVELHRAETLADRYQRLYAYAYTLRDGDALFLQGELLGAGLARVGDRIGSQACAAELLKREAMARKAKLGLWADPYYDVLDAETPADVLAQQGRFALVEGQVVSVRESGATIYVNFGRRWSDEFVVTVLKRNERNFSAAGLDLKRLEGRRIRVRGWIESRTSTAGAAANPWIDAAHPEQIEIADGE